MSLTTAQAVAVHKLYPNVVRTVGDEAFDVDGNKVEYDLDAVIAEAESEKQAQENARQSALKKLMALGLTEEEALALGVK